MNVYIRGDKSISLFSQGVGKVVIISLSLPLPQS